MCSEMPTWPSLLTSEFTPCCYPPCSLAPQRLLATEADEDHDGDGNSDDEGGPAAGARHKRGASSQSAATASTVAAGGEVSAPDRVEDLGAWSDDEWA